MLQVFKSSHPLTEFTPTWNIPFWHCVYDNKQHVDYIRNWIIDNEQSIIETVSKKYEKEYTSEAGTVVSVNDGGTGLGENSLTAQYSNYNLFKITKHLPAFQGLFGFMKSQYVEFMEQYQAITRECVIFSWANVVRKGQPIARHGHGALDFSYLSGNMHLGTYDTETIYFCPQDQGLEFKFPNISGGLTFFPSYIEHEVPEHTQDSKRVSLAFDLYQKSHYSNPGETSLDFNPFR